MLSQLEHRNYNGDEKIWVGTYHNLHNMSHWHTDNEIIFIRKGGADIFLNGEICHIREGRAVFCQSGTLHYINSETDGLIDIFLFDNSLANEITSQYALVDPVLKEKYDFEKYFEILRDALTHRERFYESKTNALITYLITDIFCREQIQKISKDEKRTVSNLMGLLNYIDKSYEFLTFSEAADYVGLSETYFSKLFKRIYGMTFSQYLNIVRIEKAIELITADFSCPITKIASECGYSSIRHFNRMFSELTGYSPTTLPADYHLDVKQFKTESESFNPTLNESKLIK